MKARILHRSVVTKQRRAPVAARGRVAHWFYAAARIALPAFTIVLIALPFDSVYSSGGPVVKGDKRSSSSEPAVLLAAAGYKPNARCDDLQTGDLTNSRNPMCEAAAAIYVDKHGEWIHFEKLDGGSSINRVIQVAPPCKIERPHPNPPLPECGKHDRRGDCMIVDPNCPSLCGKPSCFVCVGTRCGCIC